MSLRDQCGAAGALAAFLDAISAETKARFGLTPRLDGDRHRLAHLHGGRPSFPGWWPRVEGGAPEAFWIDFRNRAGRTLATGGALLYKLGPADLASWINAGGMDADGHRITIEGDAAKEASGIRLEVGFSGNLWVHPDCRGTEMSARLSEIVPLLNKAVALSLWPQLARFVTFVRDVQLDHLAPRYRLPVLAPGVRWSHRFHETAELHLGVQTRDELLASIRVADGRSTPRPARTAA